MIRAACHCEAVRIEIAEAPKSVFDCNCSICRRYGALWAYYPPSQVRFVSPPDATDTYLWGDKRLAFHRCKHCGCMTHWQAVDVENPQRMGVNARMMLGLDPANVSLHQYDHGQTGIFWTKS